MQPTILLVDDDKFLLNHLGKKLAEYNAFTIRTAENGLSAVKAIQNETISLVVADLLMPGLDGFGLLSHIAKHFPDLAVIIMTAHGKPKTRDVVMGQGAVAYIEKPFKIDDLVEIIQKTLSRESEGGKLHDVSLDMFMQLVEMEQKTCTLRVVDQSGTRRGVLFFKDGVFLNARLDGRQGKSAAYEIFAWDQVTLSIENACRLKRKVIEGDLQGILFEAMRLKDELQEEGPAVESEEPAAAAEPASRSEANPLAGLDLLRRQIAKETGADQTALEGLRLDSSRAPFVDRISRLGSLCAAGTLKVASLDLGGGAQVIVVPVQGADPAVLAIDPPLQRDRLVQALSI